MATAYLLESLHRIGHDFEISVVCEEERACYNRVLLSSVLAGEKREQDLTMLSPDVTQGVRMVCGTRIERIEIDRRALYTHRGAVMGYDLLIIATGSSVSLPALADRHIEGIEVFRSLDDTRHLRSLENRQRSVVVVGGGLLGLEAAHGLNALGCATTVVHRNTSLMNRQLDTQGARVLQDMLEAKGISFHTGCELTELHDEERRLQAVSLSSGAYLPCDILLFATGITPNAAFARDSGVATDRGILIDDQLRTSADGIFALGECAQLGQQCFGLVAPVRAQAEVLASRLCGRSNEVYHIEDWPTQLKISGIELFRAGELDAQAANIVLSSPDQGIYRRLVVRDNRLIGAVLVGDKRHGGWYSELIDQQADISGYRQTLMFGPTQTAHTAAEDMAA